MATLAVAMLHTRAWRPQGSPLLYDACCLFSSRVVATLAVAMPYT